jgi:hypothetical protein
VVAAANMWIETKLEKLNTKATDKKAQSDKLDLSQQAFEKINRG